MIENVMGFAMSRDAQSGERGEELTALDLLQTELSKLGYASVHARLCLSSWTTAKRRRNLQHIADTHCS